MNILILQSPYSFFFNDIGLELKKRGSNVYSLNFNIGDWFLKKNLKSFMYSSFVEKNFFDIEDRALKKKILEVDHLYKQYVNKVKGRELNKEEILYFYQYVITLRAFIKKYNINCIIMQNDTRWQHAYAIAIAKELGVKYWVFELGLFRPNTITMDTCGVNYNNSIPKNNVFFAQYDCKDDMFDYTKPDTKIGRFKRNFILAIYLVLNKLSGIVGIKSIENKPVCISEYLSRYYYSYIKKYKKKNRNQLPKRFIFVPLQVNLDSQILVHSRYDGMIAFIEDVIKAVQQYREQTGDIINIIFKEHPMDRGKFNYNNIKRKYANEFWIQIINDGNTGELIEKCSLIITINSTVGLEGIEKHKKVICIGKAFYAVDGIAKTSNVDTLSKDISLILKANLDNTLLDKFIYYLKYNYSIEGNEYFYNLRCINKIVDRIIK